VTQLPNTAHHYEVITQTVA